MTADTEPVDAEATAPSASPDSATAALGRGTLVFAFLAVQVVAFLAAYVVDRPTAYVVFALASVAAVAWASGRSEFAVAATTVGTVLLLALALPIAMFVARQDFGIVAEKAASPSVHHALYLAVYGPLVAAVVSLLLGVPLAYVLSRGIPGRPLVESLIDLPLVVPHSVAGLLVLFGFGEGGLFPGVDVLGTMVGMTLALTFVSAPYAVNAAREAFESVERRLEYAARAHGASEFETFRRVTAPLSVRGMLTGGVLAWARSVSEFGAVAVVAYSVQFFFPLAWEQATAQHAPVFVYNTYLQSGLEESGAVAALLLAVSAGIFLLVRWLTSDTSSRGMP